MFFTETRSLQEERRRNQPRNIGHFRDGEGQNARLEDSLRIRFTFLLCLDLVCLQPPTPLTAFSLGLIGVAVGFAFPPAAFVANTGAVASFLNTTWSAHNMRERKRKVKEAEEILAEAETMTRQAKLICQVTYRYSAAKRRREEEEDALLQSKKRRVSPKAREL